MLLSNVCAKSLMVAKPPTAIVESLKMKPLHLERLPDDISDSDDTRISVGGEILERQDLETLENSNWVNDKIINAFLGQLKEQTNQKQGENQVFVLPSYLAVLWKAWRIDHWLFKKVQFSSFENVLMPINVNDNHWILLYANIKERRVGLLDSLNGNAGAVYLQFWRQFMTKREEVTEELFGKWTDDSVKSNKQQDGSSCGIFTLMNAECIIKNVPHQVMCQVHVQMFRRYVRGLLLHKGKSKQMESCDLPGCNSKTKNQKMSKCDVCGRWLHRRCANVTVQKQDQQYLCIFCEAAFC